jgi:hypothetical protein
LDQEVNHQPRIAQENGESEVEIPNLELLRRCPRSELLDLLVRGLNPPTLIVPLHLPLRLPSINT